MQKNKRKTTDDIHKHTEHKNEAKN